MPWDIRKSGDQFCVHKTETGEQVACHESRDAAERQIAALNASESMSGRMHSLYLAEPNEVDGVSAPFEVLRAGSFERAGEEIEITEADLDQMVANFEAMRERGADELPVDFDHSFAEGGESKAAGWIKALVRKGASLFARVKWTTAASQQIRDEEYRYISAEFHPDWTDEFGEAHGFTLLAAGLTNRPFLRGMTPVALSDEIDPEAVRVNSERGGETPPEVPEQNDNNVQPLTEERVVEAVRGGALTFGEESRSVLREVLGFSRTALCEALELDEAEADGDAMVAAVNDLKERLERSEDGQPTKPLGEIARRKGKVLLDQGDHDKLQKDAKDGRRARAELAELRFEDAFRNATREGRVTPSQEEDFKALYEDAPTKTLQMLDDLAPVIPTKFAGSGVGAEDAPEGVEPERHMLHRRVEAHMRRHNVTNYNEALEAVLAEEERAVGV